MDAAGEVMELHCSLIDAEEKPKGAIHWVNKNSAVGVEVRLYEPLFSTEEPSDEHWEVELNRNSERVIKTALVDPYVLSYDPQPEMHFQFERLGFFAVDSDSRGSALDDLRCSGLVFNLTVNLKDSKPKVPGAPSNSRKDEQARQLAEKQARMSIPPEVIFRKQTDLYSAWDEDGVPTHDAAGDKVSKSAYKNLKKEWEKQKKLFDKYEADNLKSSV
jgi:glutaminyl-tRNA synthetase